MIHYIIAAGIGAFLGSQSKKSKKAYAHGGGVNDVDFQEWKKDTISNRAKILGRVAEMRQAEGGVKYYKGIGYDVSEIEEALNPFSAMNENNTYAEGGKVKFRKLAKSKNFDIVTPDGRFEIEMGAFGMPKSIIVGDTRKDINTSPIAKKYRSEIQSYLDNTYAKGGEVSIDWEIDVYINFEDTGWIETINVVAKDKKEAIKKAKELATETVSMGNQDEQDATFRVDSIKSLTTNWKRYKDYAHGGEVGEDEDGKKYEILWGDSKPFKSGDMAYNPMSGTVMEVYFDENDADADDEYYVQETYARVKKLNKGGKTRKKRKK